MQIGKWYKAKRQIIRKGKTLLDLTLNQLAGIDPVSDELLDELCKNGYSCAKKERIRRRLNGSKKEITARERNRS